MGYATKQDMIDRFSLVEMIQLTDKASPATGAIVDAVLNRAIADSDGDINAALTGRYQLPLAATPPSLVRVGCDLARYYLYEDHASDQVERRFKDAVAFLDRVAKGLATIGVDAAGANIPVAEGGVEFNTKTTRRAFATDDEGKREFG